MDTKIKKDLIDSYQSAGGFIVHDRAMLEKIYKVYGIDPKTSTDRRIFDLEGVVHFFQSGVIALFEKLGITKDDYVLSLGEGSGAPSRLLTKLIGCRVVGIDINPDQIAKANECAVLHGVRDRVEYYEQNAEELSLDKKDFTKAYCNETTCHWQEKEKAFKRIYAHLKGGAKIGLNEWLRGGKGTLNDAYDLISEFAPLYKKGIWFQEDLETYRRMLERSGFRVLNAEDCTEKIDIKIRAKLKTGRRDWDGYVSVMGDKAMKIGLDYYKGMLLTHYDFLKYGVIIAQKD
ncbi:MAG: methyltransferase domain-containing protein [Candidatus Omnitrophota bacterium]|nr:methyltransferase domain-containing protein [Candidatus Omnitrophota bacterium]